MKKKFQEALHTFHRDAYKLEHDPEETAKVTQNALQLSEETLDNAYHYHFHRLPDASRAEIINMINNYTLEALLPPVVEKLVMRQVILEKRLDLLTRLLERALDMIDEEEAAGAAE